MHLQPLSIQNSKFTFRYLKRMNSDTSKGPIRNYNCSNLYIKIELLASDYQPSLHGIQECLKGLRENRDKKNVVRSADEIEKMNEAIALFEQWENDMK